MAEKETIIWSRTDWSLVNVWMKCLVGIRPT